MAKSMAQFLQEGNRIKVGIIVNLAKQFVPRVQSFSTHSQTKLKERTGPSE